ncbi:MAG: hypothetical protein HOQ45_08840, partial [Nocardioidaceae bacterium]|nr:hypothetical protein [Nocardioidaceae bacterium]
MPRSRAVAALVALLGCACVALVVGVLVAGRVAVPRQPPSPTPVVAAPDPAAELLRAWDER